MAVCTTRYRKKILAIIFTFTIYMNVEDGINFNHILYTNQPEISLENSGQSLRCGIDKGPLTPLSSLNILKHIAVSICFVMDQHKWISTVYYQVLTKQRQIKQILAKKPRLKMIKY